MLETDVDDEKGELKVFKVGYQLTTNVTKLFSSCAQDFVRLKIQSLSKT